MEKAKLAIVILNWNGYEITKDCLDSLLKNEALFAWDIFVLDNGSKENEAERIRHQFRRVSRVRVLDSKVNLGFTDGNNRLLEEAAKYKQYDYYLLLNNDTEVSGNFIQQLMNAVGDRVGVFGPQVRYFEKQDMLQSIGGKINLWTGICRRLADKKFIKDIPEKSLEKEVDYIFGCAFIIAREVIEKIGKLRSDFFIYYEEVDYCVRAKKNGYVVRYLPVEAVYHKDSVSTRKLSGFHIYMMFRNRISFLKEHASRLQRLVSFLYLSAYLPYFTLVYGLREATFLVQGTIDGIIGKKGSPFAYRTF
ncbi:MAG: hypothetical protein A3I29_04025 [Candidatus Magasanikbacteria bacterium RIFCSPLOWO2_02_FULL_44_11]|uniref:Glycosyltransferase 2-like domain-containing protein n=2 Tax=Candidatus Magasanikiibacteriota TaxID=1752731 RepID=A0A1F6N9I6_9BACT|nr:MAG: hypothetical protein A3D53_00535 [Candidatus Magasanikbacteria bacterium RIFCSPHIGHO2_02_FULL_45_10]OGH80582.1 MAG: hypothetical protein A3I29_04025 [Candidatus Magasanikbacteria bacterium RIFCSPLOWO2_02_FULL_44_11]